MFPSSDVGAKKAYSMKENIPTRLKTNLAKITVNVIDESPSP